MFVGCLSAWGRKGLSYRCSGVQVFESPGRGVMSFFGFGQSADLDIVLSDSETRKNVEHKTEDGKKEKYFLFFDGDTVSGKLNVTLKNPGKRLEHYGIKIEFIGMIGGSSPKIRTNETL